MDKQKRNVAFFLVALLLILSSPLTKAQTVLEAMVEAELLNVRASASTDSEVIGQLKQYKSVIAF